MKKSKKVILTILSIIILIGIIIGGFFGYKYYDKKRKIDFQIEFIGCMDSYMNIQYNSINNVITEKEAIERKRKALEVFLDFKKEVPKDFEKEYGEFYDEINSEITNYANNKSSDKEGLGNLLKVMSNYNTENDINFDDYSYEKDKCINKYDEMFGN